MKKSLTSQKSLSGFTLIELLVIIAISIVMASLVIFAFYNLLSSQSLSKDFSSVVALTERSRSMSMNSKNDSSFGVHFASTSATLFSGPSYSATSSLETYYLNARTKISGISLTGGTSNIVFNKITGYASATGTVSLVLVSSTSSLKSLTVFQTGVIQY
ncbi:MAG: hypothetical protein WCO10_01575 [bacterium]